MKLNVVSDIHHRRHADPLAFVQGLHDADVLVIAGDLETKTANGIFPFFQQACEKFEHVVFVCGNHDYWNSVNRNEVHGRLRKYERRLPGLHFLNNETVTIEGQRFVGTPLWWRPQHAFQHNLYAEIYNDYNNILGYAKWVAEACDKAVKFLAGTIQEDDVVVTHWCPRREFYNEGSAYFPLYVTNMRGLQPALWCFGHTHFRTDMTLEGTRYVHEPYGYEGEGWTGGKVIEINC